MKILPFLRSIKSNADLGLLFILSYVICSYYVNADQFHYLKNYNDMKHAKFLHAFQLYRANLGTREPIYFLMAYFFSNLGVSKVLFSTACNCFFYLHLKKYLFSINLNKFLIYAILFSNFYLLVLYFSDDRLKLAFLFLILWLQSKSRLKNTYLFLSIFSHVQILISLAGIFLIKFRDEPLFQKFNLVKLTTTLIFVIAVYILLSDHIYAKAQIYIVQFIDRYDFYQYIKLLIFFIFTLILTNRWRTVTILFLPLFVALFLFGPTRVNMMGYLVMMYFGVHVNRGLNFPVLTTSVYFGFKGVLFFLGVILAGDGFFIFHYQEDFILNILQRITQ
jgi:hypothetical protein